MSDDDPNGIIALAGRLVAKGEQPGPDAEDVVNTAMVRQWVRALGDANPIHLDDDAARAAGHPGAVAPPAMAQVWTMGGYDPPRAAEADAEPGGATELLNLLDDLGYTGVVATNCDHVYDRYLRPGERVRSSVRMGEVSGPKRTAMGEGYFVTWHTTWYVGEERTARMLFRILKFRPGTGRVPDAASAPAGTGKAVPYPLRPATNQDTAFFWDGARAGELRIQRCTCCGAPRHPPGPMCPRCHATGWDHVVAAGHGEVESFVVHHHPPVPGRTAPFTVAVVALPEGVRVVGNVLEVPHEDVYVGMPVEVTYERVDDDTVLPQWRPRRPDPKPPAEAAEGDRLPDLALPLTRSMITAAALATQDYTPLHHDPDIARDQGSADIFLNILTSIGLVQRYVTDWAGPAARVHAIELRLGAPAYAGDTLTLTGAVTGRDGPARTISVRGADSLGDHVTATVRITLGEPS